MIYIGNAFSMNMLSKWRVKDAATETDIKVQPIADPVEWLSAHEIAHGVAQSVVWHEETVDLFSRILQRKVVFNRTTLELTSDDFLLVGQYTGPRLEEGATELPQGAEINWIVISVD